MWLATLVVTLLAAVMVLLYGLWYIEDEDDKDDDV